MSYDYGPLMQINHSPQIYQTNVKTNPSLIANPQKNHFLPKIYL